MRRSLAYGLVVLLLVAGAGAAQAKRKLSKADRAAAKAAYQMASTAYDGGDYETAAAQYQVAYDLTLDPALLFNLAQALRLGGQKPQAMAAYEDWLAGQKRLKKRKRDLGVEKEVAGHVAVLRAAIAEDEAKAAEAARLAEEARQAEEARRAAAAKKKAASAAARAAAGKPGAGKPKPVAGKPKPKPVEVAVVKPKAKPAPIEEGAPSRVPSPAAAGDPGGRSRPAPVSLAPDPYQGSSSSASDDSRPFYKKWWFWTGAALVVGGGVAAIVILTRDEGTGDELGGIGPGRGQALGVAF